MADIYEATKTAELDAGSVDLCVIRRTPNGLSIIFGWSENPGLPIDPITPAELEAAGVWTPGAGGDLATLGATLKPAAAHVLELAGATPKT